MEEMICRLCLQIIGGDNCQPAEESLLKSLKLNINISKENVMCIECANCIRAFSNFTLGCVYTEHEALPLSDLKNGVKSEPEPIATTTNLKSFMETKIKCGFCTKTRAREDLMSLQVSKENKSLLQQYIPETNIKNTEELLSCENCLRSFEGALSVILKCLEVEEKISKYVELEGTNDKGQVELKKVQQYTFRPVLKSEIESLGVNELEDTSDQVHEKCITIAEAERKYENEICNTELIIKSEGYGIKIEQDDCDIADVKPQQNDYDGFQENKNRSEIKLLQCEFCTYQAKWEGHLKRHLLTHKNPSITKMFKCEFCTYQTKWRTALASHLLTHKNPSTVKMFKCGSCSYQTKWRRAFINHLPIHKNPQELKMFKCEICSHKMKRKSDLKYHLLTHKSPSEIKMFKCALCSYESKQKVNLKSHVLTHKNPSEIKMFECEFCTYQAKWNYALKRHLLTHENPQEIEMFKCEICSYETKRKSDLKYHLLTHKNPSEIKMFKCEFCLYQAKRKKDLASHLFIHKNLCQETEMFKCEVCSYETKRKCDLKYHLLTHKSPSEMKMFKCEFCSHQTKRKDSLIRHLLTHKNTSSVKMFKFESCSYQAK